MDEITRATDGPATPAIYLISGPAAAGRSNVARLLAARFERSVHLEGEFFRRSIVAGRIEPRILAEPVPEGRHPYIEPLPDIRPEALEQLRLSHRLAAAAADGYLEAGFTVALEDRVAGALLGEVRAMFRGHPCHVIVLLESTDAGAFVKGAPGVGIWIDTSGLSAEETVDLILERTSPRDPASQGLAAVTAYDPQWPALFRRIALPVQAAVGELGAQIEHVGSTSVTGLRARPIIDMDVILPSAREVPAAIERLRSIGYVYQGDKGIPGREAFIWPDDAPPHDLYVVVANSRAHREHIDFRDYLRAHPETAREYAALKDRLAAEHGEDRLAYAQGKGDFIQATLRAARAPGPATNPRERAARMASIRAVVQATSADYRESWTGRRSGPLAPADEQGPVTPPSDPGPSSNGRLTPASGPVAPSSSPHKP